MDKYIPREWFSVIYKNTGKKKCDCGWEMDAMNMVAKNPTELTYVRNDNYLMGQVIDVEVPKALPTNEIVVNMDGGVGGSWEVQEPRQLEEGQLKLKESDAQVFVP